MYRGDNTKIDFMMGIPVIGELKMAIIAPDNDPDFVYYFLYYQDVDLETGEIINVQVSLREASNYVQAKVNNTTAILEFVAKTSTYGLLNWGFSPGVEREVGKGAILEISDYLAEGLGKVG